MKHFKTDLHLVIGLIIIGISSLVFIVTENLAVFVDNSDPFPPLFFLHYALALVYYVILWKTHGRKFFKLFSKETLDSHMILLCLFNISAYALNRNLPVFQTSVDWVVTFLVIENALLVFLVFLKIVPTRLSIAVCFLLGGMLLFNIYQTLMILPFSALGFMGIPFLGLSLLLFVPVFYVYGIVAFLISLHWSKYHTISLSAGIFMSCVIILIHVIQWQKIDYLLSNSQQDVDAPYSSKELPEWVLIAQDIHKDNLIEKYLKTGLVYQEFTRYDDEWSSFGRVRFEARKMHDPLVSISSLFSRKYVLDDQTKVKILNYLYDSRHESGERFWSGRNLTTRSVTTNIELFDKERLSFTELIITVSNNHHVSNSSWRNQQEAFYTFNLPEGGVVTSLSLWIEGVEQKGILTSKKKAETAYNTIVGREMRDPSVVYWMEGNKIRVRVFPCTPEENRKFKIGVTSPLRLDADKLVYDPISFVGPDQSRTTSKINLVTHDAQIVNLPKDFERGEQYFSLEGDYETNWKLEILAKPLSESLFSYHDEYYWAVETPSRIQKFEPTSVYLDLSSSWTTSELKSIASILNQEKVFVFGKQLNQVNPQQLESLNLEKKPAFTLFPFYKIRTAENSLIITKGGMVTPNLNDLEGSSFKEQLFEYFNQQESSPLVIDIAERPSDYLKSLNEFGVIDYHHLKVDQLLTCFETNQFPKGNSDPKLIDIPLSKMSISKSATAQNGNETASDHLMRLFYYQKIMDCIGKRYFSGSSNEYLEDELVEQASIANVVTPLSSLIVLETQNDYDRFGIEQNKDSLGNASIENSGAVPEPHEWALIIVGVFTMLILYWKSKSKQVSI